MDANSPWPLRFDLVSANVLVWFASVGRDAELTQGAHLFFFDRYYRLAQLHRRHGHLAAAARLLAKAFEHYRAGDGDGPPFAAAMAMPRPRRWISVEAVGRPFTDGSDDAA